jgi:DNA repair protein RadC
MSTEQLEAERSSSAGPGTGPAELPSVPDTESRPAAAAESTVIPAPPKGAELLIRLLQAAGYTTSASLVVDQLLDRFGTVRAVLDAPRDALAATLEWDANVIPLLEAARHLVDNLQNAELPRRYRIENSDDLLKYVEQTKRPSSPGVRLLLLDADDFLVADFRVSASTSRLEQHVVQSIISEVIASEAPNVILVVEATRADPAPNALEITQVTLLRSMLAAIDVSLHDCLVTAEHGSLSFRCRGLL